jgi:MoxR-like ATPase
MSGITLQYTSFAKHVLQNDHFHISHFYQPFNEVQEDIYNHPNHSTGSVVRSRTPTPAFPHSTSYRTSANPLLDSSSISTLTYLASTVKLHPDIRSYLHNLTIFLRMHRAITSGITPHATRHMYALINALAVLHGLEFVTPSLVALAVRKVYPHRIVIVRAEDEMSLQWGSSVEAVRQYLEGVGAEDVIEDVLGAVEVPL